MKAITICGVTLGFVSSMAFQSLAATASWNGSTKTVTVTCDNSGETIDFGYGPSAGGSEYYLAITGVTSGYTWGQSNGVKTSDVEEIIVYGGTGNDVLKVNQITTDTFYWDADLSGNITLRGGYGDDELYGSALDDELRGENDDDIIKSNGGSDAINGGGGIDHWIDYSATYASVISCSAIDARVVSGELLVDALNFSGDSRIYLTMDTSGSNVIAKLDGHQAGSFSQSSISAGKVIITGSDDDDIIDCTNMVSTAGVTDLCEIHGEGGDDTITSSSSHMTRAFGGGGNDAFYGGSDDFVIDYDQAGSDTVYSGKKLQEIWQFTKGDIAKTGTGGWDDAVSMSSSIDSSGTDPIVKHMMNFNYTYGGDTLRIPANNVVPRMMSDGSLECFIRTYSATYDHSQIKPFNQVAGKLWNGQVYQEKRYRMEIDANFPADSDWSDTDMPWVTWFQTLLGNQGPSIQLLFKEGDLFCNVRGDDPDITNPPGNVWDSEGTRLSETTFSSGLYHVAVEFTRDVDGPDGLYYTRFEIQKSGGTLTAEESRVSNARQSGNTDIFTGAYSGSFSVTAGGGSGSISTDGYPRVEIVKAVLYSE